MQTIDGEEFLDSIEVVTLLGVKRATLYTYVSRGLLRSYKQRVGRQRLYKRSDVEALLAIHPDARGGQEAPSQAPELPYAESWAGDH